MEAPTESSVVITPAALGYGVTTLEATSFKDSTKGNITGDNPADSHGPSLDKDMNLSFFTQEEPKPTRRGSMRHSLSSEAEARLSWQGIRVKEALGRSTSLRSLEVLAVTKDMDVSSCSHRAVIPTKSARAILPCPSPSLSPPLRSNRGELKSHKSMTNLSKQMAATKMIPKSSSSNNLWQAGERRAAGARRLPNSREVTRRSLTPGGVKPLGGSSRGLMMAVPNKLKETWEKLTTNIVVLPTPALAAAATATLKGEKAKDWAPLDDSISSVQLNEIASNYIQSVNAGTVQASPTASGSTSESSPEESQALDRPAVPKTQVSRRSLIQKQQLNSSSGATKSTGVTSKPPSKRDLLAKQSGGISTLADEIAEAEALEALEASNLRRNRRHNSRRTVSKGRRVSSSDIAAAKKQNNDQQQEFIKGRRVSSSDLATTKKQNNDQQQESQPQRRVARRGSANAAMPPNASDLATTKKQNNDQQQESQPQRRVARRGSANAAMPLRDAPTTRAVPGPTSSSASRKKRASSASRLPRKQQTAPSSRKTKADDSPDTIQQRRLKKNMKRSMSMSHENKLLGPPPGDTKTKANRATVRRSSSHDNPNIRASLGDANSNDKKSHRQAKRRPSRQKSLRKVNSQRSLELATAKKKIVDEAVAATKQKNAKDAAVGTAASNIFLAASCHAEIGLRRSSKTGVDEAILATTAANASADVVGEPKKKRPAMKKSKSTSAILMKAPPQSRPRRVSDRSKKESKLMSRTDPEIPVYKTVSIDTSSDSSGIDKEKKEDKSGEMKLLQLISDICKMELPATAPVEGPSDDNKDDTREKDEQQSVASSVQVPPKLALDVLIQEILAKGKPEEETPVLTKQSPDLDSSYSEHRVHNEAMVAAAEAQSLMVSLDILTKGLIPSKQLVSVKAAPDEDSTIASMEGATGRQGRSESFDSLDQSGKSQKNAMHGSLLGTPGDLFSDDDTEDGESSILKTSIAAVDAWRQSESAGSLR